MKILHTSDWHLGIPLEQHSRREEQEGFINEIIGIAESEQVDLVLCCGDVYDTYNPPAWAEKLFFKAVKGLSGGGRRAAVYIAGNHDSPERLAAPAALLADYGALVVPLPDSVIPSGDYGGFRVDSHGPGCFEISISGENAVIAAMPFASEKRLNELLAADTDEHVLQQNFSQRIGHLFAERAACFRDNTVNIAAGHFHIIGGDSSTGAERDIQLGGSFAVAAGALPSNAQYIAMGHLHRCQRLRAFAPVYYSGSPLQYSLSEVNQAKGVYLADIAPNREAVITQRHFSCARPVELWRCGSIAEAFELCEKERQHDAWVYLVIASDRPLTRDELRELRALRSGLAGITLLNNSDDDEAARFRELSANGFRRRTLLEEFEDFYLHERGEPVPPQALELFKGIVSSDGTQE